jgi:hypothetical protein
MFKTSSAERESVYKVRNQKPKAKAPGPPRWEDEPAVLNFITQQYERERAEAADEGGDTVIVRPPKTLRSLAMMMRSGELRMLIGGEEISPQNKAHLANLLDDAHDRIERMRDKRTKSIDQRWGESLLPEAEQIFAKAYNCLRLNYPKQLRGNVKTLAIKWTVERLNRFDEIPTEMKITKTKLRTYVGRSKNARQRLSEKPQLL